jgi:integrase/recombinase XerD
MRPSDPFEGGSIASRWSVATRRKTAKGYGRFLCWLKDRSELDETAGPAARVTRETLNAYLDDLKRTNRGHTIQCRIQELGDAMQALEPQSDWRFIKHAAARLRATTVPARDKRGRLPPIAEVIARGYRMMERAEETGALSELGRAALYRDGLLLVFLAIIRCDCVIYRRFASGVTWSFTTIASSSYSMRRRPRRDYPSSRNSRPACLAQ